MEFFDSVESAHIAFYIVTVRHVFILKYLNITLIEHFRVIGVLAMDSDPELLAKFLACLPNLAGLFLSDIPIQYAVVSQTAVERVQFLEFNHCEFRYQQLEHIFAIASRLKQLNVIDCHYSPHTVADSDGLLVSSFQTNIRTLFISNSMSFWPNNIKLALGWIAEKLCMGCFRSLTEFKVDMDGFQMAHLNGVLTLWGPNLKVLRVNKYS